MRVGDIMSRPATTCRSTDTLNAAARFMWERDCGALPVVDETGSVVGVVTDRDACMAAYTRNQPLSAIPVAAAMAKVVYRCHADDSLEVAERLMFDKQIRRLPVVDEKNRPVGVLSLNDITRWSQSTRENRGAEHMVAETLAGIGRRRPTSRSLDAATR